VIRILAEGLLVFIQIYYFVLLARIIMSWFMFGAGGNPTLSSIYRVVYGLTEPLLVPIRRIIPSPRLGMGYLDLSPIILLILLRLAQQLIIRYFYL